MSGSLAPAALTGSVERIPPQLAYRPGMPDAPSKLPKGAAQDEVRFHAAFKAAKAGKLKRAISGFEQTFRLNPKNADALYNLGVSFFEAAEFEKALGAFHTATAVNAELAFAYFCR
jgi:tetratricopeptide (TPR) repeat protein